LIPAVVPPRYTHMIKSPDGLTNTWVWTAYSGRSSHSHGR